MNTPFERYEGPVAKVFLRFSGGSLRLAGSRSADEGVIPERVPIPHEAPDTMVVRLVNDQDEAMFEAAIPDPLSGRAEVPFGGRGRLKQVERRPRDVSFSVVVPRIERARFELISPALGAENVVISMEEVLAED